MADVTDEAEKDKGTPTAGSYQDRIRDAVQNSNEVEDDNEEDKGGNAAGADNVDKPAEADKPSNGNDSSGGGNADDAAGAGDEDKGGSDDFRFTQFKGDGSSESYVKNLEEGYENSSKEAIRLKARADEADVYQRQVEAIKDAAAKDPEFEKKIVALLSGNAADGGNGGAAGTPGGAGGKDSAPVSDNPFLRDAQTKWEQESEQEAKEFTEANPEVLTDPKVRDDVKRWMRIFSNETYEAEGRLMKAGEAMEKAYRYLGLDDKRKQNQNLVDGLKGEAAPTRPSAPKKKPTTSSKQFSDLTLNMAQRMGISKERLEKTKSKR